MQILRKYGSLPFCVALIHGGPGAVGEMEPVARELAAAFGVLEPIQTETTLDGQVEELKATLEEHAKQPIVLVGFSWGAWLSTIVTAEYPYLVKKLILVGSGPYEPQDLSQIGETRTSRLTQAEQEEYNVIIALLNDPAGEGKSEMFARLGQLANKTDRFNLDNCGYKPWIERQAKDTFYEILREEIDAA